MTGHFAHQEHKLLWAIQKTGELQEIESNNVSSVQEGFYNLYAPTARNKDRIRLLFGALFQRSYNTCITLSHGVAVFPGDTTCGLCTQYRAWTTADTENNLSIEDVACMLQEIPATTSPCECWIAVVAGLIGLVGTTRNTEIALKSQTEIGGNTVEIMYEMSGPIFQRAGGESFHRNEDMQMRSVVNEMREHIVLTEKKLMQLASSNPDEFPVSQVWFRYFTYGAHGIRWELFVSFRDGRFAGVRARGDEIAIHARSGYVTISDSLRPSVDAFAHTGENWKRALRSAISVISADSVDEMVGISRIVECLSEQGWGQSSQFVPGYPKTVGRGEK